MITSSREQLLGYLLGALEPHETAAVEQELKNNDALRRELQTLQQRLAPLESTPRQYEAPSGLADRTCQFVALQTSRHDSNHPGNGLADLLDAHDHARQTATRRDGRQVETLSGASSRWTLADAVVLGGVVASMLIIFFPAMYSSIDLARRERCQDNLRTVGQSLVSFSDFSENGRFPMIPAEGKRSFAGVVASILHDRELLPRPTALLCPGSPLADEPWQVVTLQQIDAAQGAELQRLRKLALGSMGYNLGVTVDGRYQAPRNLGRSNFVLMTDAPCSETGLVGNNHDGRGQNMLFEDNHTAYVVGCRVPGSHDDAFRNRRGRVEAGLGVDDSVIGSSATPPFLQPAAAVK